jgi:hypothetical protein
LPFGEISAVIVKLLAQTDSLGAHDGIRLLRHTLSFVELNLGQREGSIYNRRSENGGEHMDCWIDVLYHCDICYRIGLKITAVGEQSNGVIDTDKWRAAVPYYYKALAILETWKLEIEKEASQRIYMLDEIKIDAIWENLTIVEDQLRCADTKFRNFIQAEDHAD